MEATNVLILGVDILLGVGTLASVFFMLSCSSLYRSIILFVVFSLFLSLIWVRLSAPDVALAEAAIGAGLTGALFISAVARLKSVRTDRAEMIEQDQR